MKSLFELEHRVWHCGVDSNRTQLLVAILAYPVPLRYNHRYGQQNSQVHRMFDMQ